VRGSAWDKVWLADDFDGFLDVAMRLVDVFQGALLQTPGGGVIFFAGDVIVRSVQELNGAAQAAVPIQAGIDRRVVIDVFSVVDCSFLDLGDGIVNFVDGLLFLLAQLPTIVAIEVSSSVAQVAESMKVSWMFTLGRRFRGGVRGNKKQHGKKGEEQFAEAFHRL
jgi:hypothetical protein